MTRPVLRAVGVLAVVALPTLAQGQGPTLNARVAALEAAVAKLQGTVTALQAQVTTLQKTVKEQGARLEQVRASEAMKLNQYLTVTREEGLPLIRFTGVNLQLVNGVGPVQIQDQNAPNYYDNPILNGLGNLIIGYNETGEMLGGDLEVRTGSHNLVVGPAHTYSSHGGFVAGFMNKVTGVYATVSGGLENEARGAASSVSGGDLNRALGNYSSVSGGVNHTVTDPGSWAAGSPSTP